MSLHKKERLLLVGNGMAGMRTIDELLVRDRDRYDIEVIGAEPHPNYNRIMLSSVLAGEKRLEDIVLHSRQFYAQNNIALTTGDAARSIDTAAKTVTLESGRSLTFDKLILATGSRPVVPPLPGLELPGNCAFRDIADLQRMQEASRNGTHAVVIGGGLLGLEAAFGLMRLGMKVTVLHLMQTLMERQLDEAAGYLLQRDLITRGINVITLAETESILGNERASAVRLSDGRELTADLVVFAIGVRPNIDLARKSGLEVNRGIKVDDTMRSTHSAIYAVGECVEHRGMTFGLVAPLWLQAKTCAAALCDETNVAFTPPANYTSLKITGIDVFSAGVLGARDDGDEEVTLRDAGSRHYKKLVIRDDKLVGAILYGEISDGPWFVEMIESGQDISAVRDRLLFGRALAQAA